MTELPKDWKRLKLSDVAEVIMGQSPPGSSYNEKGLGVPFFQGKAEFGDKHPTVKKWTTAGTKFAKNQDILMSVRAPVGPTNVADRDCVIGRGLAAIRANELISHDYLMWFLKHVETSIQSKGKGSTFDAISGDELRSTSINVPPISRQLEIVDLLNFEISKLEKVRGEIASTRLEVLNLQRSIYSRVFADRFDSNSDGEKDFSELFTAFSSSHEGYKQKEYSTSGLIPIVDQGAQLIGGYTNDESRVVSEESPVIVFGDHTRRVKYVDFKFAVGADGTKLLRSAPGLLPKFGYWQLVAVEIRSKGYARHFGELKKEKFWFPDLDQQREIVDMLDNLASRVSSVSQELSKSARLCDDLKRSLLHSAFSGEL